MGCANGVERFRPGTTLRLPFLVIADGTIVDITDGTVSAVVEPIGGTEIVLTAGNGLEIVDVNPPVAPPGGEQEPHGYLQLEPSQTAGLPYGQMTELTLLYLSPDGVQTYAPPIWLRGE